MKTTAKEEFMFHHIIIVHVMSASGGNFGQTGSSGGPSRFNGAEMWSVSL